MLSVVDAHQVVAKHMCITYYNILVIRSDGMYMLRLKIVIGCVLVVSGVLCQLI